jgi:hypothetical protein
MKEPSKEMLEGQNTLTTSPGEFMTEGHGCGSQYKEMNGIFFVDALVSGLKMVALVDTDATHHFVSEWTAMLLHYKIESNMSAFKVVKSTMKPTIGVVRSAPLKFGNWFGILDLTMAPLDDHLVVLGKDFLKIAKVVLVPHESLFVFLYRTKTLCVPMTMRRKLVWMPIMSAMRLMELASGYVNKT